MLKYCGIRIEVHRLDLTKLHEIQLMRSSYKWGNELAPPRYGSAIRLSYSPRLPFDVYALHSTAPEPTPNECINMIMEYFEQSLVYVKEKMYNVIRW